MKKWALLLVLTLCMATEASQHRTDRYDAIGNTPQSVTYNASQGHFVWAPPVRENKLTETFTFPEASGSLERYRKWSDQITTLVVKTGRLELKTLVLGSREGYEAASVHPVVNGDIHVQASFTREAQVVTIRFDQPVSLAAGQTLEVRICQVVESTYQVPEGLVYGGAFIDRIKLSPLQGQLRSDVWGGDNVLPRDVNNGIEDDEYSYWGGNIVKGDDSKYHMFVCRWAEDNVKGKKSGHHTWWSSIVVRAVSDDPLGPYKVVDIVGPGHNPEIYRKKDGSYVIGVMGEKAYVADTLNGPWTEIKTRFDWLEKDKPLNKTNRTYVVREDGSVLMVNKNGYVFISDKADEHFTQVTAKTFYPWIKRAHLEDPVIWKDEVQYHAIVNDAFGRVAFYFRSLDGLHWKWAPGTAYNHTVVCHDEGTCENWFKLERPKVLQDAYGRATHLNVAAIDSTKEEDRANDNHSSKNVVIPLTVPRRLQILNRHPLTSRTKNIQVRILAEEGFDPLHDVDWKTLKFGAPEEVNFGRGCEPIESKPSGDDLIVIFKVQGHGISSDNFTAKLIGRMKDGGLVFGYALLPE